MHDDGRAVCRQIEERLPDRGRRQRVDAPSGLVHHKDRGVLQDFAANDELLEVPARERTGRAGGRRRADVKALDDGFGKASGRAPVEKAVLCQALADCPREGRVFE